MDNHLFKLYQSLLYEYMKNGSLMDSVPHDFLRQELSPEKLLRSHLQAMEEKYSLPPVWKDSFHFLLRFMEHQSFTVQELLSAELSLAASMQQSLLLPDPHAVSLPDCVDMGLISKAARKVNGDFYNILPYDQGVEFSVADIAGKSMPAAIFMSMIKFAMDSLEDYGQPHTALKKLNRFVHDHSEPSMFVTMFMGDYHTNNHCFYYSSAGHEPALLYRPGQGSFTDLSTEGCALGLSTQFSYETKQLFLEPGDIILVYTDGIIERRNSHHADNNHILRQFLPQLDLSKSAQELTEQLLHLIENESMEKNADDQTLLLFRRKY